MTKRLTLRMPEEGKAGFGLKKYVRLSCDIQLDPDDGVFVATRWYIQPGDIAVPDIGYYSKARLGLLWYECIDG
jgi:hypothetical protein